MNKLKIGVLGPSEIAFRRTVPAFLASDRFEYFGVACANAEEWSDQPQKNKEIVKSEYQKALKFKEAYGGEVHTSYKQLLASDVDAVYIPLPPALHKKWALEAIKSKKHVFCEKPFTTGTEDTEKIINAAKENGLAVHENFAFVFHKQLEKVCEILKSERYGELRLIRAAFGFPYRGENDFRYHKTLGGGALLDCGGYPIKLASYFLGDTTDVVATNLHYAREHDVDVYGSATLSNNEGVTAQIAFGMDNSYKCELELWCSHASIYLPRVFTPTADMRTQIIVKSNEEEIIEIEPDDQFKNSAEFFYSCVIDSKKRSINYETILKQTLLMEKVRREKIYG